jgi:hypothetical protein
MERPTPEKIKEAREVLLPMPSIRGIAVLNEEGQRALAVLLAATEPTTEDEISEAKRNHFRAESRNRLGLFCIDQRGDHRFDVYFEHSPGVRHIWEPSTLWHLGKWALAMWSKQ